MGDTTSTPPEGTRTIQWAPNGSAPVGEGKSNQASIGACDACRARKVRCLASDNAMSSKCQRCARANRECVYTVHSKTRRRKRTDTRVKELEEKVRNLSVMLERQGARKLSSAGSSSAARQHSGEPDDGMDDEYEEASDEDEYEEDDVDGEAFEGDDSIHSSQGNRSNSTPAKPETEKRTPVNSLKAASMATHSPSASQRAKASSPYKRSVKFSANDIGPDVVDRGILNLDKATELFDRFANELVPHYPGIAFPAGTTAIDVRRDRPILFLATMAAAAGTSDPALNLKLNQEILQVYANKVALQGQKNIDLVQSICIQSLWYYPPERFDQLKFHQYIHMAATMALDLGLAKRPRRQRPRRHATSTTVAAYEPNEAQEFGGDTIAQPQDPPPDSSSIESRRTLLACYLQCASVSLSLRLPNALRFTTWMGECVEELENSPDAVPTDKRFAAWVRLQRISEDCVNTFSLDDPGSTVSLDDDRIQNHMKSYERQLESWRKSLQPGVLNDFLEVNYHVNNIFIHEISLHPDHEPEDFRPPFYLTMQTHSSIPVQHHPAYVNAIMECYTSAQKVLELFTSMDVEIVRALPALIFVRTVYSAVVLIKLEISADTPRSELASVIDTRSLNLPIKLNKVVSHTAAIAGTEGKNLCAMKFLMIMKKLMIWYRKYRTHVRAGTNKPMEPYEPVRHFQTGHPPISGGPAQQPQPQQQAPQQPRQQPAAPRAPVHQQPLPDFGSAVAFQPFTGMMQQVPAQGGAAQSQPENMAYTSASMSSLAAFTTATQPGQHAPVAAGLQQQQQRTQQQQPPQMQMGPTQPSLAGGMLPDFHGALLANAGWNMNSPSGSGVSGDNPSPDGNHSGHAREGGRSSQQMTPELEYGTQQGVAGHTMEVDPGFFGQLQNEQPLFNFNPDPNDWMFDTSLLGSGSDTVNSEVDGMYGGQFSGHGHTARQASAAVRIPEFEWGPIAGR